MNTREALSKIFYQPREVFAAEKQDLKGGHIFLILVVISIADITITNFSTPWHAPVDLETSILESDVFDMSDPQDTSAEFSARPNNDFDSDASSGSTAYRFGVNAYKTGDGFPSVFDVFSTFFDFALLLLFEAVFLRIVGAIIGLDVKIDQWFALVAYSWIPATACVLLITVVLAMTLFVSRQILGSESDILTRLILSLTSPFPSIGYFLDYRHLSEIWVIALQTIGFRDWSGKSTVVSFMIVIAPTILVYGLLWWLVT